MTADESTFRAMFTDELMTAWRAGMCDGLEMAAQMAETLIGHGDTTDEQRGALRGLRGALRECGVQLAAEERTR